MHLDELTRKFPHFNKKGVSSLKVLTENLIATGHVDGSVFIWNVADASIVHTIKAHDKEITAIQVYNDCIVTASADSFLRMLQYLGPTTAPRQTQSIELPKAIVDVLVNASSLFVAMSGIGVQVLDVLEMKPVGMALSLRDVSLTNLCFAYGM
jgi:WD40 repeat protein